MAKKQTVESAIAQAALQEKSEVVMGGRKFKVSPPTIATLMKISTYVSQLPQVEVSSNDVIGETLRCAKDGGLLSDIIATAVVGSRSKYPIFDCLLSIPSRIRYSFVRWFIENKAQPKELQDVFVEILVRRMQTDFFLHILTSVSAVNTTKPTKTTALGQ